MTEPEKRQQRIHGEFRRRKKRQLTAIALTVFLLVSLIWKMGHPGLVLGELPRPVVTALEISLIAVFAAFSAVNWRCPACNRYLGPDISPQRCRKCGSTLQ